MTSGILVDFLFFCRSNTTKMTPKRSIALLQILLGKGIHIDFSSQLKFAKIGFYGALYL